MKLSDSVLGCVNYAIAATGCVATGGALGVAGVILATGGAAGGLLQCFRGRRKADFEKHIRDALNALKNDTVLNALVAGEDSIKVEEAFVAINSALSKTNANYSDFAAWNLDPERVANEITGLLCKSSEVISDSAFCQDLSKATLKGAFQAVLSNKDFWQNSEIYIHQQLLARTDKILKTVSGEDYITRIEDALDKAQKLAYEGSAKDVIKLMEEALEISQKHKDLEKEAEICISLAAFSSERRGVGDRIHYLEKAESLLEHVKKDSSTALFYRAKAGSQSEKGEYDEALSTLRRGLKFSIECKNQTPGLLAQACLIRANIVHHLCETNELVSANKILNECDEYANNHQSDNNGELFYAAVEAGMHLCIVHDDLSGAEARVYSLVSFANTKKQKERIAGDLVNIANQASHQKKYEIAELCACKAVELAKHLQSSKPELLSGALYTEAAILYQNGQLDTALEKALAVLPLCEGTQDDLTYAVNTLISGIQGKLGNLEKSVKFASAASNKIPKGIDNAVFSKITLAKSLFDVGRVEEALAEQKIAWTLVQNSRAPQIEKMRVLEEVVQYSSQLGELAILNSALGELDAFSARQAQEAKLKKRIKSIALSNLQLRQKISFSLENEEPAATANTEGYISQAHANSAVVSSLLELWGHHKSAGFDNFPELYDFWGRGNYQRILLNTQRFPNQFNITIEVRSLEDVKQAIALWGLYADLLVLLWKGPLQNGMAVFPVPEDYDSPGGAGYNITSSIMESDDESRIWRSAMGWISTIPEEVILYLSNEAIPLLRAGRLILVPANTIGCINPGHGAFEQLAAEAANSIPILQNNTNGSTLIASIPFSPDAPISLIAEIGNKHSKEIRRLRSLLIKRSMRLDTDHYKTDSKLLALEIDDAFEAFKSYQNEMLAPKGFTGFEEPLGGGNAPFKISGNKLATSQENEFAPIFMIRSGGYGYAVNNQGLAQPSNNNRFEPSENDLIGTWLAEPEEGWNIPTAIVPR